MPSQERIEQIREELKRKKTCTNKTAYNTYEEAQQLNQLVYVCPYCGLYHRSASLISAIRTKPFK